MTRRSPIKADLESGDRCHAGSDGDCTWNGCPQEANGRADYQLVCPLYVEDQDDG